MSQAPSAVISLGSARSCAAVFITVLPRSPPLRAASVATFLPALGLLPWLVQFLTCVCRLTYLVLFTAGKDTAAKVEWGDVQQRIHHHRARQGGERALQWDTDEPSRVSLH
jgi:hypothetical protein